MGFKLPLLMRTLARGITRDDMCCSDRKMFVHVYGQYSWICLRRSFTDSTMTTQILNPYLVNSCLLLPIN